MFVTAGEAKIAAVEAVKARVAQEPALRILVSQVESFVKLVVVDPTALAKCGIHLPQKRSPANGTMGAKQRKKAAQAAQGTTVGLGADGLPLPGAVLPAGVVITTAASANRAPPPRTATPEALDPQRSSGVGPAGMESGRSPTTRIVGDAPPASPDSAVAPPAE